MALTKTELLRDYVSVKEYGAIGDGSTDDRAAIQAALDASDHIIFPKGTYKVVIPSTTIEADPQDPEDQGNLYLGIEIKGSNKTILGQNSTILLEAPTSSTNHPAFGIGTKSSNNISNVKIDNLTIDLNHTTNDSRVKQIRGMMFSSSDGIIIKDCKFYNDGVHNADNSGGYGISLVGSDEVTIDSCKFENISGGVNAIYTNDLQIVNCRFEFFNEAIDLDKVCTGTLVSGCYFDGEGSTVGSTGEGIDANGPNGLTIASNTFRDLDSDAIIINGKYHATSYTNFKTHKLITGIVNNSSNARVTSAAHGFENGDVVYVSGIQGFPSDPDTINSRYFTVGNKTTDTFDLLSINQTGTYTRGGAVWKTDKTSWNQAKNVTITGNTFNDTGKIDIGNAWSGTVVVTNTTNLHDHGEAPVGIVFSGNSISGDGTNKGLGWLRIQETAGMLITNNYWKDITAGSGSYAGCIQARSEVNTTTYPNCLTKSNCNVYIANNVIENVTTSGISLENPGNFTISNNYITKCNTASGSLGMIYGRRFDIRDSEGQIVDNTLIGVSPDYRWMDLQVDSILDSPTASWVGSLKIRGNIFKGVVSDANKLQVWDTQNGYYPSVDSEVLSLRTEAITATTTINFPKFSSNAAVTRIWCIPDTALADSTSNYFTIQPKKYGKRVGTVDLGGGEHTITRDPSDTTETVGGTDDGLDCLNFSVAGRPVELLRQVNAGTKKVINQASITEAGPGVFTSSSHGWQSGQEVYYNNAGGTTIGGLVNESHYYICKVNDNTFNLCHTFVDAINGANKITVSNDGNDSQYFVSIDAGYDWLSSNHDRRLFDADNDEHLQITLTETGTATFPAATWVVHYIET